MTGNGLNEKVLPKLIHVHILLVKTKPYTLHYLLLNPSKAAERTLHISSTNGQCKL
jgi:hypothetical protein